MRHKTLLVGVMAAVVLLVSTGVAIAGVSDGNYDPARQHCSGGAEDVENSDSVEDGCQNLATEVNDGNGNEAVRVGLPQLKDGEHPDPTRATYTVTPDGFDPSTGVHYYFGADDNLDNGEHDGSSTVSDGPSDGGAIVFNVSPESVQAWLDALAAGDAQYLATHPFPLIDAGIGACADGICFSAQSQRRLAYDGGSDTAPARDVANYDGYQWDPETCSSADPGRDQDGKKTTDCNDPNDPNKHRDLSYWHDRAGDAYIEPGVQVYEDPSPNGSPIGPYPLPALYAGTCGLVVGGGPLQLPASPVTNDAGQVVVTTTC